METISVKELDKFAEMKDCLIIDLRSEDEYHKEHVKNAINVPHGEFHGELEHRKERMIVLYCDRGALSMATARKLEESGYKTATVIGGYHAYKKERLW